ncbi:MAG: hypothetical protein EZS28_037476 [Streblomastix strix]|uniref:non-specific serine/threonine protein kinase n=1 Tax=Streblomastix strix TaxID=222440 RepID=A0A5J4U8U9_9EUKA|nr:MAG: hypothetical protein EZS28_037476 [Streblomastix strix]
MKVKLADFGFARKLQVGRDFSKFFGGTLHYQAPELLQSQKSSNLVLKNGNEGDKEKENNIEIENQNQSNNYLNHTFACDIWALGIIFYEILEYHHPFLRADETLPDLDIALRIVELEPYDLSPNRSDSFRALIKRMLVKDPSQRITAEEILEWPEIKAIIMKPDEEQKQDKDEDI